MGKIKPDMVVKNQSGVFLVDVTVRHEDGDYLKIAKKDKETKYGPLLPAIQRKRDAPTAEVLPIVVGTRGAMPLDTRNVLNVGHKQKVSDDYFSDCTALFSCITRSWTVTVKPSSHMGRHPAYIWVFNFSKPVKVSQLCSRRWSWN
jgi:hypothetical protein